RRKSVRARTYLGGVIAFNRRASTMNCHVRNLSPSGAKVAFTNAVDVPDQFDLTIGCKERSFRARMVWRGTNEAGIAFLEEYIATRVVPLEWAKRLRHPNIEDRSPDFCSDGPLSRQPQPYAASSGHLWRVESGAGAREGARVAWADCKGH